MKFNGEMWYIPNELPFLEKKKMSSLMGKGNARCNIARNIFFLHRIRHIFLMIVTIPRGKTTIIEKAFVIKY